MRVEAGVQETTKGNTHFGKVWLLIALLACGWLACMASYSLGMSNGSYGKVNKVATVAQVHTLNTSDIDIYELWSKTNAERQANDLSSLSLNPLLNASASAKCNDMVAKNYWAHNDPAGNEPWHFITDAGYHYYTAAENLGYGFQDADTVVNGWMNSAEHRSNMLNPNFTDVGFAVCKSDNYQNKGPQLVVVEHFAKPY